MYKVTFLPDAEDSFGKLDKPMQGRIAEKIDWHKIVGTEILDAVKRFGSKDVFKKVTLEDLALHA